MSDSSFSLCTACGHVKPAGVSDCEYCSGQQKAVSLEDLKLGLMGAQQSQSGVEIAEEPTKEPPPPVETLASVPEVAPPLPQPEPSSPDASRQGIGGFIDWLRRIFKF